ncbi:hypothetical protein BJ912DRAFT_102322 [Pholiota molesta]|nr:hypothetical protein BJ912DRAFT_102322 [Pholiota molesta]
MLTFNAFPLPASVPVEDFIIYDEREPYEKIEREIQALRRAIAHEREAEPYPSTLAALWAEAPAQFRRAVIYDDIIPAPTRNATYELDLGGADVELEREPELSVGWGTPLCAEAPIQESHPITCQDNKFTATANANPDYHSDCSPSLSAPLEPTPGTLEETDVIMEDATSSEDSIRTDSSTPSTPVSTEHLQLTDSISPNGVMCRLPASHGPCGSVLSSIHDVQIHIRDKETAHLIGPVRTCASKQKDVRVDCPWPGCASKVMRKTLESHIMSHMVCFVCPVPDCKSKKSKSGGIYGYKDSLRLHLIAAHDFEQPVTYVNRFGFLRADNGQGHPM